MRKTQYSIPALKRSVRFLPLAALVALTACSDQPMAPTQTNAGTVKTSVTSEFPTYYTAKVTIDVWTYEDCPGGCPLEGATLTVSINDGPSYSRTTGADGRVQVKANIGDFVTVLAEKAGYYHELWTATVSQEYPQPWIVGLWRVL